MQPRHTPAKARVTTVRPSEREIKGEGKRKYREGGMKKKSLRIKMSFHHNSLFSWARNKYFNRSYVFSANL
jgi:hypothetical protein